VTAFASGQKLPAAQLSTAGPLPQGTLPRGNRITNSSTTTTEVGVERVDSIPIVAGRLYRICTSPLVLSSTANDIVRAIIRISTSGSATTSSTVLDFVQQPVTNTSFPGSVPLQTLYTAPSTATLSVLLSVSRQSGTGNASILGASTFKIDLWVEDIGVDQGDTGVDI
jgi:hypothetical protein